MKTRVEPSVEEQVALWSAMRPVLQTFERQKKLLAM